MLLLYIMVGGGHSSANPYHQHLPIILSVMYVKSRSKCSSTCRTRFLQSKVFDKEPECVATTSCKSRGDTCSSSGIINLPNISHTAAPPLSMLLARQTNRRVGKLGILECLTNFATCCSKPFHYYPCFGIWLSLFPRLLEPKFRDRELH